MPGWAADWATGCSTEDGEMKRAELDERLREQLEHLARLLEFLELRASEG